MLAMRKQLVVKDNVLINAATVLSLTEQRLLLLAIIDTRASGAGITASEPLTVHASRYAAEFSVTRQAAYSALREAASGLFERRFSYQEERKKGVADVVSRWVSQIAYIEEEATIEMVFSPAIVPLITSLEKHFTSYQLEQVRGLTSFYAIRLYELLIAWRGVGKANFELEALRGSLGIAPTAYQRIGNFKSRVLDIALKQINDKTDLTVQCHQQKSRGKVAGFSFTFQLKSPAAKQADKKTSAVPADDDLRGLKGLAPAQASFFASKLAKHGPFSHITPQGKSESEVIQWLAVELQKDDRANEWGKYLKAVGFSLTKPKT